jgi:hypothetical protein
LEDLHVCTVVIEIDVLLSRIGLFKEQRAELGSATRMIAFRQVK